MGEWGKLRISDVAVIKGGKRLPKGSKLSENPTPYPYIRVTDVSGNTIDISQLLFVPEDVWPAISRYTISAEDIFISIVGTIGLIAKIPEEISGANLTENAAKISCDRKVVDPNFLRYFLISTLGQNAILEQTVGSTQPKLALFRIGNIEFPAPPLPEQRAIASVLSALDDKIALNRRMNETLEGLARALFKDWFVDFGPTRAKMALSGTENGRGAKNTQTSTEPTLAPEIWSLFPDRLDDEGKPEGWEAGKMSDLFTLQRGFDLPSQNRREGSYPILAASGPSGFHESYMVKGPGVTTGRSGVLGRVFFVHGDFWPLNTSLWIKDYKRATPRYAYFFLKLIDLAGFNAGSAVPTLNRNHIHGLPTVLPPQTIIAAFDNVAEGLMARQRQNEIESRTLAQTRDLLLPRLMSGKLRVGEAEGIVEGAM